MKSVKIIYALIIVVCVIAIALGIYAQFFVKEEDKSNIIIPTPGIPEEIITEKTPEELKTQLDSLFTNVLNKGENNTLGVSKINAEQDIVYTSYDLQDKNENYEINIYLPTINIQGKVPEDFNNITQNVFYNKAKEILNSTSDSKVIYQVNYTACINENILSVAIQSTLKEGNNPQRVIIQTYNYNLSTGQKVPVVDLIAQKNLIQSEVQAKINSTIEKAKEEAEILVQSGYTVYNRVLNSDIYKLSNISNYLLGPNGNLYIIFPYGNQNFTSEMDIVFYE